MDLTNEENRRALAEWAAELRASVTFDCQMGLPKDEAAALAKLEFGNNYCAPAVHAAVTEFARTKKWPANIAPAEGFFINLRVMAAARTVEGLLSGALNNPAIAEAIGRENPNFTEWMLTAWWDVHRDLTLKWFAKHQGEFAEYREA